MKGVLRIGRIVAVCVMGVIACAVLGAVCVGSGVALHDATTCAVGGTPAGAFLFGGTISINGAVFGGSIGTAMGCFISFMAVCITNDQNERCRAVSRFGRSATWRRGRS